LSKHLDNSVRYQQVSDEKPLHLPALSLRHSIYWERDLLKKAVILTAGVRFRYQTAYQGDRFMPASGFYFLQDSVTTSGQPLFDVFTDFRIKGATIYIASENVLQPVVTSAYYLTPSYPQPGRTFRFGIRWFFLDQ
ncbi:MAG: putative porin, partial [Flavobacteriales bacterium]